MSTQPFGAGIIGIAHSHAFGHMQAIRSSKNWKLIGVAEPNAELSTRARENSRWEDTPWTSPEALLSDERVQMICIETDPLKSLPYALQTIEAGKHVKIDKPPGVDYSLLQKIFAEAERRHLLIQMGYVYRYNPAFQIAYKAVKEGWLGQIRSIVCQMNDMQSPAGRQRIDRYRGGQFYEICCHMLDVLIWLMGEPHRVSPTLRHSDPVDDTLEDDVQATYEFDEAVALIRSNTRNGERFFHIFGDTGSIFINDPDRPRMKIAMTSPHGDFQAGVQTVPVGPSVRYIPDLDDLAGAIREHREVKHFTPEHDLAVQRTLLKTCGLKV
jgi:predicted dehydrogenase